MNFVVCKSFGKNFVNIKNRRKETLDFFSPAPLRLDHQPLFRKGAHAQHPKFFSGRGTDKTREEIKPKLYLIARLFSIVFAVQEFFSVPLPLLPSKKKKVWSTHLQ